VLALFMGRDGDRVVALQPLVGSLGKSPFAATRSRRLDGARGLAFHPVFVAATDAAYANILPALGGEIPATLFK